MEWIATQGIITLPVSSQGTVGNCWVPRLRLHHGGVIDDVRLSYELTGKPTGEVIVVLGGISANRHVCATPAHNVSGWWEQLAGNGLAVDTQRFRVLGFDYLGGNGESTGPREEGADFFPSVSTFDQADCLARILDHLGIERVRAVVGASYGGMVGLAFAARHPERLSHLVVVSAAHTTAPMSTAWRSLQRRIIKLGLATGSTREAVTLSRGLAMTTYRSAEEFQVRFDQPPRETEQGFLFPVEEYLDARGAEFADRFHPKAFLCLSESIDLHRVDPQSVLTPTTLISVTSDLLVPPRLMQDLAAQLPSAARLVEIDSLYGHDAFLKEIDQIAPIVSASLNAPIFTN